ncbi:MAG TPA: hypothetical protein VEL76_12590 [Gemmataceae bacterium]|nr:hypothetical protein [Gemmataceae bacterium]
MSTPRRRLIRPTSATPTPDPQAQRRVHKLRTRLEHERALLTRWLPRLKRAFHTVEKQLQRIARIERQLRQQEDR